MGSRVLICCVAATLLFIQPIIATDGALPPSIASFADDVCDGIDCGNGTCKAYKNFEFSCECNPGWRRYYTDERFRFMPCVIPNCSLNLKCRDETAAPPPEPPYDYNRSFTDPCAWAYCGGGTCIRTSTFGHRCDCKTGFLNLFDNTRFPCLSECALGKDCQQLGVVLSNRSSASTTPGLADSGRATNEAWRVPSTQMLWPVIFMISFAMVPWI